MSTDYLIPSQPDILEVISNLSNDEVFTPPRVVNAVLDMLPDEVWSDPTLRWLDPGCKTGVFPREITKRLMRGLAEEIPDEAERLDHILRNMVFAIAITEITSMMARRTLYCSKDAAGEHSATAMQSSSGNVWFERVEHAYVNGRCSECSGTKNQLEREGRDNYAYGFIHSSSRGLIDKEVGMQFDVIVGNPPYQMADGGQGGSASPIYQKFIETAIALNPQHIAMIVPSKWMAGGRGLDDFRHRMKSDRRVVRVVDFQNAQTLFPVINLNGGINYFLWSRDFNGKCSFTYNFSEADPTTADRYLDEFDVVVRDTVALGILRKVLAMQEDSIEHRISSQRPFGMRTDFRGSNNKPREPVRLYQNGGTAWIGRGHIEVNADLIDRWKVLIPAASDGNEIYPLPVVSNPIVAGPGTACTETYLVVGPWNDERECEAAVSYINTRFFRFMLNIRKPSQHNSQEKFRFIPDLPMNRTWTDEELFVRYGISDSEIRHIESVIRGQ